MQGTGVKTPLPVPGIAPKGATQIWTLNLNKSCEDHKKQHVNKLQTSCFFYVKNYFFPASG
jgi:hypothetical protein